MQRHQNESFADYKQRRAASNAEVKAYTRNLSGGINSRQQFRDSMRASGAMGKRIRAADALVAAWAQKRVPKWKGLTDEHGAYTVTGSAGRKWLAGISAQRGF